MLLDPTELICVECGGTLTLGDNLYRCNACNSQYPMVENIPVLLPSASQERAQIEDSHWKNHITEGVPLPAWKAFLEAKPYIEYFEKTVLCKYEFRGKILELGGGRCFASALMKLQSPSSELYASDISLRILKTRSKETEKIMGCQIDHKAVVDALRLPFRSGMFDFVFGMAFLHHLQCPQDSLLEIHRVLKNGGIFIAAREPLSSFWLKPICRRLTEQIKEERRWGSIEKPYTYSEWKHFLEPFRRYEINLKQDPCASITALERNFYRIARHTPDFILRKLGGTIRIWAIK